MSEQPKSEGELRQELENQVSELYKRVSRVPVSPASFSLPGVLPGGDQPAGYAIVYRKLEQVRQALQLNQLALAERRYYEADTQFEWCKENVGWISDWWGPIGWNWIGRYPRWFWLIAYAVAWVVGVGAATELTEDDALGIPLQYVFWGTLGGATAGVFGVWIHRVRADFDPNYSTWYLLKPAIGSVAGAFVVLISEVLADGFASDLLDGADSNPGNADMESGTGTENGNDGRSESGTDNLEALLLASAFVLGFFESLFISVLEILRARIRNILNAAFGEPASKAPVEE